MTCARPPRPTERPKDRRKEGRAVTNDSHFFRETAFSTQSVRVRVVSVDAALSIIDEHRKTQTWKQWKIYLVYEIQFSTLATFLMKTIYAELGYVHTLISKFLEVWSFLYYSIRGEVAAATALKMLHLGGGWQQAQYFGNCRV